MKENDLITGVRYEVSLKNVNNSDYCDVKFIIVENVNTNTWCVNSVDSTCHFIKRLFTGTIDECKNFVSLMFKIRQDVTSLREELFKDYHKLASSTDSYLLGLSDRIKQVITELHPLDCTYELENILRNFHADTKDLDLDDISDENTFDDMVETYEELIERQVGVRFGHVMFSNNFKSGVKEGCYTDDDGCGNYLTEEGFEGPSIDFYDLESENWTKYPYVVWYNK